MYIRSCIIFSLTILSGNALAVRCSDFPDQESAQKWHEDNGGNTRLDRDKDGEACECLPGGSAHGSSKCR